MSLASLPTENSSDAPAGHSKQCIVRAGKSWFALPAQAVREVTLAPALVRIPGAYPVVEGMGHMRNEFIVVLRLDGLLATAPVVPADETPHAARDLSKPRDLVKLVVLNNQSGPWAVLVDDVIALASVDTFINPDAHANDMAACPILGTASYGDEIVRLIDPHALYRKAEAVLCECWAALRCEFGATYSYEVSQPCE